MDHHLHTGKPWQGFNGLGWYDNPVDSYAVPPIDNLDYAAFQHDKAYDRVGAKGLKSAFFDKRTAFDDLQFAQSAFNNSSQGWGVAAGLLFELIGWHKLYRLAIRVPF